MSYQPFSKYHVIVSSGDNPGGAESLCQAAEKQFPGLMTECDGIESQPTGLVMGLSGGNAKERQLIKEWLISKREHFC
jgi:hypothetical protein